MLPLGAFNLVVVMTASVLIFLLDCMSKPMGYSQVVFTSSHKGEN